MSKLTGNEVQKVAELAKLNLTPEEIKKFESQLSEIVNFIDELSEVDTEGVEPTSQTNGLTDVTREDEIRPFDILKIEETYKVDKILKHK